MKTLRFTIFLILMVLPTLAFAEVPGILPVQGVLTDGDGNPITDDVTVVFTVYGVAGDAAATVHSETLTVSVDRGFFSVALGAGGTPLDLDVFKDGARELGIKVGADAEMTPRLQFGTTPFAAHARTADDATTFAGNTPADFVGTGEANSVSTAMIADAAITGSKIANGAITPAKLANSEPLYRVSSVYCENEVGTVMSSSTCRASQHNADSCTNICRIGTVRARDCSNACVCAPARLCIIGQPCDPRGSHPQCPNTALGAAVGN